MQANLHRDISLAELAGEVGLSPHHLCRAFRESVGLPPHRYLVRQRVERAKALIAAGTPLVETALNCGFANQQHLAVAFRRATGTTPGRWRRDRLR
jgi:AraC family transcriptional regulator